MDIKQLKTFICVAETGSLSAASDRLRLAQPALSRQIKLLEHKSGAQLFHRSVKGMALTESGEKLLSRVQELLGSSSRQWMKCVQAQKVLLVMLQ